MTTRLLLLGLCLSLSCSGKGAVLVVDVDSSRLLSPLTSLRGEVDLAQQQAEQRIDEAGALSRFGIRLPVGARGALTVKLTAFGEGQCLLGSGQGEAVVAEESEVHAPVTLLPAGGCTEAADGGDMTGGGDGPAADLAPAPTRWPEGMTPEFILGDGLLKAPTDVCFSGRYLFVSDRSNHRIVIFDGIRNGAPMIGSIGKAATGDMGQSGATLLSPAGLYCDSTVLLVADSGNHRVLYYDSLLPGAPARAAIGQENLVKVAENRDGPAATPAANTLKSPTGVYWSRAQRALYIADYGNNRVVAYPAASEGQLADLGSLAATKKYGQPGLTSGAAQPADQGGMSGPAGVFADGDLVAAADSDRNRVLVFRAQTELPVGVLGQQDLLKTDFGLGKGSLRVPSVVRVFESQVFVADRLNGRVLIYDRPLPTSVAATPASVEVKGLSSPGGVLAVRLPEGVVLVVADTGNDQIKVFRP